MKCYCASYNVGNVEVWASGLYRKKKSLFSEIKNSVVGIAEAISSFSLLNETEIIKSLNLAFVDLKKFGMFKEKENQFDFFILEQSIGDT